MAFDTSLGCARKASPSSWVQSSLSFIIVRTWGTAVNPLTLVPRALAALRPVERCHGRSGARSPSGQLGRLRSDRSKRSGSAPQDRRDRAQSARATFPVRPGRVAAPLVAARLPRVAAIVLPTAAGLAALVGPLLEDLKTQARRWRQLRKTPAAVSKSSSSRFPYRATHQIGVTNADVSRPFCGQMHQGH